MAGGNRPRRLSRREFLRLTAALSGASWAGLSATGCQAQPRLPKAPTPGPVTVAPAVEIGSPTRPTGPQADRAYQWLLAQCAFGPRNPGSAGHTDCRRYLVAELAKTAHRVTTQDFAIMVDGVNLELTNIIGQHNPEATDRVLLCAHWDTRPYADQDPRPEMQNTPIPGANDGASGVAALLELSQVLKDRAISQGVDIVLFDGEDYGRTTRDMFLGSRHYASSPLASPPDQSFGILLDMIGDADLQIYQEGFSVQYAAPIVTRIWNAATELGYGNIFIEQVDYTLNDDHLFLNAAGIPTADVIDFRYPYWHTVDDTPDKCSGTSLQIVCEVVLQTLIDYWRDRTAG